MAKEVEEFKYGIGDLADKLGIEEASTRIKLRNAGIKKASNGRYGWKTKSDLDEVVEKLKNTKAAPAKKSEKPAPKKSADKESAKKSSDKKAPAKKSADKPSEKSKPSKKAA